MRGERREPLRELRTRADQARADRRVRGKLLCAAEVRALTPSARLLTAPRVWPIGTAMSPSSHVTRVVGFSGNDMVSEQAEAAKAAATSQAVVTG